MKAFLKRHWNKFIAAVCAAGIVFMTVISSVSMAASGSPASWDDVSDDAIALRDAYYEYFINSTSGDLLGAFKTAKDIPIAWLTTLKDGVLAISPADDIYYYLKDGKLSIRSSGGGGHIRSGASSGGGYCRNCKKPAAECTCDNFDGDAEDFTPFLSGKDLKDIAADYNSRYMPIANEDQYFYHFQGDNMTYSSNNWYFHPFCPVYLFEKQWGNKGWTDFYFIPVISDDDKTTFYGQQYGHIYAKNVDGTTTMYFDLINMLDDSIVKSFSFVYDATTYKWIGLQFNGSLYNIYGFNSSYNYLNGKLVGGQYAEYGPFVQGINMLSWDGSSTIGLNFLLTDPTFSPKTNKNDDWGYILSNKPFELFANQTKIDFDRVPNNYIITINGDTIYDYSITNPDTDDSTDFKDYVDHNYDIPDLPDIDDPDDGGGSGGSTSGSVVVGGKVDVSGDITIKSDPININVNVNSGSSSGGSNYTGEAFDMSGYLDKLPEQSETMGDYLGTFFNYLPPELLGLIIGGVAAAILCRVLGR